MWASVAKAAASNAARISPAKHPLTLPHDLLGFEDFGNLLFAAVLEVVRQQRQWYGRWP